MLYRILLRLAGLVLAIEAALLVLAFAISPASDHLHMPDAAGLMMILGLPALLAGIAWVVKPRGDR